MWAGAKRDGLTGVVARDCRPDLRCHVSRRQGAVNKATEKDKKETNQVLDHAQVHSDAGITLQTDAISWDPVIVVTVSDAPLAHKQNGERNR